MEISFIRLRIVKSQARPVLPKQRAFIKGFPHGLARAYDVLSLFVVQCHQEVADD